MISVEFRYRPNGGPWTPWRVWRRCPTLKAARALTRKRVPILAPWEWAWRIKK